MTRPERVKSTTDIKPKGEAREQSLFEFVFDTSRIYPGTVRTITVYVPAQYRADRPACVYFSLDGLLLELPTAFDELIGAGQMPVTIAVGIAPGTVDSSRPGDNPRYNRSLEFDELSGNLARFLIEEIGPAVERHRTSSGLPIRLSKDPNDRAIGGISTGGIGSFTAAWERPDSFRRVFTGIGTFVGMRGGDRYPVLVRKTEPKPIRVFMQDGANDQLPEAPEMGDWWLGNQTMQSALEFAGYDVKHIWGDGAHDMEHATAIFPDALRWLWRDWPQPVVARESQNKFLQSILRPGDEWQLVSGSYRSAEAFAADSQGRIVFRDGLGGKTWSIGDDGQARERGAMAQSYSAMAYGREGRCYIADSEGRSILAYDENGDWSVIAREIHGNGLAVAPSGALYIIESTPDGSGKVWLICTTGQKILLDSGLSHPNAIVLSPDGLWLAVAERGTHWGYSYRVQGDGGLQHKQRFYWFHVPDQADDSGVSAWIADREGRLYAATHMGVQIFDRNGRVRAILPLPDGRPTSLAFGDSGFDTLYVATSAYKIYRRKLNAVGVVPGLAAIELPAWYAS